MNKQKVTLVPTKPFTPKVEGNLILNPDFTEGENRFKHWTPDNKGDAANCTASDYPPGVRLVNEASVKQTIAVKSQQRQYSLRVRVGQFAAAASTPKEPDHVAEVVIWENGVLANSFVIYPGGWLATLVHITQDTEAKLDLELRSSGSTPVHYYNMFLFEDIPDVDEYVKDPKFKRPYIQWVGDNSDWSQEGGGVQLTGNNSYVTQRIERLEIGRQYVINYTLLNYMVSGTPIDTCVGVIDGDGGIGNTVMDENMKVSPIYFTATQTYATIRLSGTMIRFGECSIRKVAN